MRPVNQHVSNLVKKEKRNGPFKSAVRPHKLQRTNKSLRTLKRGIKDYVSWLPRLRKQFINQDVQEPKKHKSSCFLCWSTTPKENKQEPSNISNEYHILEIK